MAVLALLRHDVVDVVSALFAIGKVFLDDVVRLHVDLLVRIVLTVVDLFHAAALFNEQGIAIDRLASLLRCLLVHLTDLENVLQTIESHLDDFVVRATQQIAEGLDATALHKKPDLLRLLQATRGGIRDGPACLLSGLEVSV